MNRKIKRAITPKEMEEIYGIPRGSLAIMRMSKNGPKYYKAGPRRVLYFVQDIEEWISRNPVETNENLKSKEKV